MSPGVCDYTNNTSFPTPNLPQKPNLTFRPSSTPTTPHAHKMPRQGDGSGDNGPIETGKDQIHGASGDVSLSSLISPPMQHFSSVSHPYSHTSPPSNAGTYGCTVSQDRTITTTDITTTNIPSSPAAEPGTRTTVQTRARENHVPTQRPVPVGLIPIS